MYQQTANRLVLFLLFSLLSCKHHDVASSVPSSFEHPHIHFRIQAIKAPSEKYLKAQAWGEGKNFDVYMQIFYNDNSYAAVTIPSKHRYFKIKFDEYQILGQGFVIPKEEVHNGKVKMHLVMKDVDLVAYDSLLTFTTELDLEKMEFDGLFIPSFEGQADVSVQKYTKGTLSGLGYEDLGGEDGTIICSEKSGACLLVRIVKK